MATKKSTPLGDSAPSTNETTTPRIKLSEIGYASLKTSGGKMQEEANAAFRYPAMLKAVAEMKYSPPVSIGLGATNILMNRADVFVEPLRGESGVEKQHREYLVSALSDMDTSWQATMQSISTYKEYGHQVSEIVMRRRLHKNGSKYNDGLVGLRGLKNRPQNSIAKWNFSESGRELVSISQSIVNVENSYRFRNSADESGHIIIPREKFLLFRCDPTDDNPEGVSILRSAYLAYKQLSLISDQMLVGISKDIAGVPFAQIPPQYLSPDASDSEKAVYQATKDILSNISNGTQSGIIFPKMVDSETKADMFQFSLLEQKSGKAYNLPEIIKMLQANILSVLSCDSLTMGDKGGSLSLQDGGTNILALSVAYRLSEIANTLNQELVPLLWKMNGWPLDRLPLIKFKDVSSVSLEEFSKAIQRMASTNCLELNRANLNKIYEVMGFEQRPEDEPVNPDAFPSVLAGITSKAGDGMNSPVGEGTRKNAFGNENASDNNNDNKG